jgi:signal peptidase I
MTTFVLIGSLLAMLAISLLLSGALLQLGLRWAELSGGTLLRSTLLMLVGSIISTSLVYLLAAVLKRVPNSALIEVTAGVGVGFAVSVALISRFYKATFVQAVKAWLPTLLAGVIVYPFMVFVYRPFVYEGFVIPTNGMAPTLIGNYVVGRCPDCGAPMFGSAPDHERLGRRSREEVKMICSGFHSHKTFEHDDGGHALDRIMVAKFLTPRRWDLAVFRVPFEPEQTYVKRVVGLPGETVTIREGEIFIDGAKVEPPAALAGIRYVTTFPRDNFLIPGEVWGTVEHPAVLGSDEYFVLGDHTTASLDSRLWTEGAEGHPPYAVPKSHLIGVATHIYWPLERMRVLR